MARRTPTVRMYHDKAQRYYDAPPKAVGFWEQHGWKAVADKGTGPLTTATTAKTAEKKKEA